MDYQEAKSYDHFAYPIPFSQELRELNLVPYRANKELESKINYIFSHPSLPSKNRQLFLDVSTSGSRLLVRDMSRVAISIVRYFLLYPQQFDHNLENIHLQLLVRMWKQTFFHCKLQSRELDEYYSLKLKTLSIENNLLEELLSSVRDKRYIQHGDDMVKRRTGKGLREHNPASLSEDGDYFKHLVSIAENEQSSFL